MPPAPAPASRRPHRPAGCRPPPSAPRSARRWKLPPSSAPSGFAGLRTAPPPGCRTPHRPASCAGRPGSARVRPAPSGPRPPEDQPPVAEDLQVRHPRRRRSRVSARSRTKAVRSSALRLDDVTAIRRIASESASAFTTRGTSTPSGRSFATREIVSRRSVAATSRSASSRNSTVTRLDPNRDEDEIDFTPATRLAAPSITAVTSRSIVSGAAPG